MTKTIDLEQLKIFSKGSATIKEVADEYLHYVIDIKPSLVVEASDEEMLSLPEKLGIFSFLNNEEEDIYSESDGSPLE